MLPTVKVKSNDAVTKLEREATAQRVLAHFGNQLPDLRLLCFMDNDDWQPFRDYAGEANRGFYTPVKKTTFAWPIWPDYLMALVLVDDASSLVFQRAFDHVIYLHGSSCENQIGLTMTFAHELQHFVQYGTVRKLWAANSLIPRLPKYVIDALRLRWSDIPIEREARVVAKRAAESLFGPEGVGQYIDSKIAQTVDAADSADWRFVQALSTSISYDLEGHTRLIYRRLNPFRAELKELLREVNDDQDFQDIDLDALCCVID